ncbi:MAG: helicase-related protein [Kiritimatiellae bacterium]|nr:helicase-related protein [Kiritimatiellia bacterium]
MLTIHLAAERVRRLVPEAKVAVAHGRMPSAELAKVMHRFVAGEFNVLVCTTIIESGLDIPRANTIIIDRADRFGIADLYQLRGRVGRSNRKAYAYLLLPAHGHLDSDSRKRIMAVSQHTGPGTGFNLALRDLEIRGAGNLLGAEQSGHIAAIGFGLYCQLLKRTIARLKNEPLPALVDVDVRLDFISFSSVPSATGHAAMIPFSYIEDESLRITAYRKLAECSSIAEVEAVREEWQDRYGPLPAPVERLLKIAEIRILAAGQDITKVEAKEGRLILMRGGDYITAHGRFPRLKGQTPNERLTEVMRIIQNLEKEPRDKPIVRDYVRLRS